MPTPASSTRTTLSSGVSEHNTVIIGAGAAGLAVGACLRRAGIPFVLLERSDRIGSSWHGHYDRLHLHTDKANSALPFLPFPKECPRYPSRRQVIEHLEAYARHFELEPKFGQHVEAVRFREGSWETRTQDTCYRSQNLVVATGYNREPHVPTWPGQASFQGRILHSARYDNGAPFEHQRVLVVGFGNSGGEIALDLWEHGAQPSLAVRSPVNVIPRDLLGIPVLSIGILLSKLPPQLADALGAPLARLVMGDLTRYGLRRLPYGPMTQIHRQGRIPLIDVGTVALIKQGAVSIYPGIERFTETGVVFTDGREEPFDAVILATGYRPRVDAFLQEDAVYDAHGIPACSGEETPMPGLYFCGFYVAATGMLREIGLEARRISADISHRSAAIGHRQNPLPDG